MGQHLGVDLSHWQGEDGLPVAHWKALAGCGVRFALIKVTQGTRHVDPAAARNVERARQQGLEVGLYHFLEHGNAQRQADHFIKQAKAVNSGLERLVLVGDVERVPSSPPTTADDPTARDARVFFRRLADRARKPQRLLYAAEGYWRAIGNPDFGGSSLVHGLWQARWDGERHTCAIPNVPMRSPRPNFGGFSRADSIIHQYGRYRYTVRGKTHAMDGNTAYLTEAELLELFSAPPQRPPMEERLRYRLGYNATIDAAMAQLVGVAVPDGPPGVAWPAGGLEALDDIAELLPTLKLSDPEEAA